MEEDDEVAIGLSAIMKLTGSLPLVIGIMILISPRTVLAVGPHLTEYGIYVGSFVAALAIIFGLTHWLVAIYVKENLHIFGRFFVLGHALIGLLECMAGRQVSLISSPSTFSALCSPSPPLSHC